MDTKRFFLYFIVITALALAGCGGNGGGTPTTMEPDMCPEGQTGTPPNCMTPAPPTAAVDLSGLLMGFGLTADDAGEHVIPAGMSEDIGNATFSCPAGPMACTVTIADDGTATSTGGQATASPSAAAQMAYDAKKEEDRKAALAKGMGIAMALEASNGPVPAGSTDATAAAGPTGVKVERATTGAPKITLTVPDSTGDTGDADTLPDLFAAADDITRSMPSAITGWMGETQSRTVDGTTDMVTVYTDIKTATPKKLEVTNTDVTDITAQANTVVLDDKKTTYAQDDTFTGTFNGHQGTFTCTSATCTITLLGSNTDGRDPNTVTAFVGADTWSFKSDMYLESLAVQDEDYLYFGYWLQDEGDNDFAFNTFFGGNQPYSIASDAAYLGAQTFTAVESRAVYTGSAAGKYVEKTLGIENGEVAPLAIAGDYFTADARLTAYFGTTPNVAENTQNTISGTISNFKNSNGDDVGFNITLGSIDFGRDAVAASGGTPAVSGRDTNGARFIYGSVSGIHETVDGVTQATSGEWEGQFFGPATGPDGPDAGTDPDPVAPTGVAGDFQAHFSDGHVVGAFGATR